MKHRDLVHVAGVLPTIVSVPPVAKRLRFNVIDYNDSPPTISPSRPTIVLKIDRWDDFGYKTTFDASISTVNGYKALGSVKILQRGQESGRPEIPRKFTELPAEFCSLGQDISYYENLMEESEEIRVDYFQSLRDAAYLPNIEKEYKNEPGWEASLLRFGQAVHALKDGRAIIRGSHLSTDRLSFVFDWRHSAIGTGISFEFDDSTFLPGRFHALIGYNGVGKTTLLADLAMAASAGAKRIRVSNEPLSSIAGKDRTFGAVVAVSYSAFDTFRTPESVIGIDDGSAVKNSVFGYVYCGLRRSTLNVDRESTVELKSIDEIRSEFAEALNIAGHRERGGSLREALEALSREPSFEVAGVDLAQLGVGLDSKGVIEAFNGLSTGHKIVLNIVAQLAAHLRTRSLVLIDEPETHLHPPLVAALLRAIQVLLKSHGSFAILATHSPVVVQELPSRYVRILERFGGEITLREPEIETFAENIGSITRNVFSLDSTATDYQGILATLSKDLSAELIDEMFVNGLSIQGRALVANYRKLT